MKEPGHELCFLSSLSHDHYRGVCNIRGSGHGDGDVDVDAGQNWKGWEVWRFTGEESSGQFVITSWVHKNRALCSGPDGQVFTVENNEGTWGKQCKWRVLSHPNAEGLVNDTTIVSEKKQLWNLGPSLQERGGYLIISAEYGRMLILDENGNLHTEEVPLQFEPMKFSRRQMLRVGTTAAIFAVAGPYAVVSAVGAMGFTAGGIAAGSTASWMMSLSGSGVAAGGVVATLQSIGAAGLGLTGTAVSAGAGAIAGAFMNEQERIVNDKD